MSRRTQDPQAAPEPVSPDPAPPVLSPEQQAALEELLRQLDDPNREPSAAEQQSMAEFQAAREKDDRARRELRLRSKAVYRAMSEWGGMTAKEWERLQLEARDEFQHGGFLLDRLGGYHFIDPRLSATLLGVRRALVDSVGALPTAAEYLCIDMAMAAYFNFIRVQGWVGNAAIITEHELFGGEAPAVKLRERGYTVHGLLVEDSVQRIVERLMPLLDRSNRMVLRNLKALRDLRPSGPAVPPVTIHNPGQVNVAAMQQNSAAVERPRVTGGEARGATRRLRRARATAGQKPATG